MVLDEVGVVARLRGEREHVPVPGIEHDGRAALAGELPHREPLEPGARGQDQVVAGDRDALELVERLVEDGAEVRVRCRQVGVLLLLQPGPRTLLGRIADQVGEQRPLRITAEVERLPAAPALDVRREQRPVGGADQAALDAELGDALDRVVLPGREPGRGPRLPPRRRDDQRRDQDERRDGELRDLPVHDVLGAFARFETSISPASRTKLATTLEPP